MPAPADRPGDVFSRIAGFYDLVMARVPYEDWVDYVEVLVEQWGGSAERTLDLACGTGSVGLEMATRGAEVVGVDLSLGMLREGRRKSRERQVPMQFVRQDMRQLALGPAFDLVVCLFDSLNYLLSLAELQAALDGAYRALAPGGLLLFDVNTVLALEAELFTQEDLEPDSAVRLRWVSHYDALDRTTRVDMEFYLPDGRTVVEEHREKAFTAAELRQALAQAGFEVLAVYDAYTHDLPRRNSDRLFYVCRAEPRSG